MNALNGLDGKSALIGGALTLGAIAAGAGGLLPLLVVGGLIFLVGSKQGWWGRGPSPAGPDPRRDRPEGVPPFFAEWHRQAHAADAWYQTAAPAPTQPREAAVRVPVTPAATASAEPAAVPEPAAPEADDRRTVGESGAPPA